MPLSVTDRFSRFRSREQDASKARGSAFDVVLMAIWMPGNNGVEAVQAMRQTLRKATVMVMTVYRRDELVERARTRVAQSRDRPAGGRS